MKDDCERDKKHLNVNGASLSQEKGHIYRLKQSLFGTREIYFGVSHAKKASSFCHSRSDRRTINQLGESGKSVDAISVQIKIGRINEPLVGRATISNRPMFRLVNGLVKNLKQGRICQKSSVKKDNKNSSKIMIDLSMTSNLILNNKL